jgi:hypothetical protein
MVIIQVPRRCNVPHKPDLRTANYAPEFPPSVITAAAVFTVSSAAIFTVSTDAVSTASAAITAAVVYVTAAAFTVIAAAAAAVFIASITTTVYTTGSIPSSPPPSVAAVYCTTALPTSLHAVYKTTDSVAVVSASDHRPHPVHPFGTRT